MTKQKLTRSVVVAGTIGVVTLLHYETPTTYLWLHQLFQRGYYVPVVLAALWFGWKGGILTATLAGFLYAPHILLAWQSDPAYGITRYAEIGMLFIVGALTGALAQQEKRQRIKFEKTAKELSKVYAQLQASFEQLRRADRLSALGELSAGLAHEIRNPLGSIEGAMQILRRPGLPEATRQEFGRIAQDEVNRLKSLVSHFLEFARPQAPRRKSTDLGLLLESVRVLAAETSKMAGTEVRIELQNEPLRVSVDPEQVKQVLLNLVINAIQAMPAGGEVVLRTAATPETAVIEVQDEGVGIEDDNVERIFDPFFTTRAGGTGLGLSIAYQIIGQHGGHIEARGNPNRGMTFRVTLPRVQEEGTDGLRVYPKEN